MPDNCAINMADNELRIILGNSRRELDRIAPALEAFSDMTGLDPRVTFHLNIALDELLTNIVSYGYGEEGGDGNREITLCVQLQGTLLTMRIEDDACPFNPLDAPEPDLDLPPEERINRVGGMGIHMIRKMMTSIEYERRDGKNLLTLRKTLTKDLKCQ